MTFLFPSWETILLSGFLGFFFLFVLVGFREREGKSEKETNIDLLFHLFMCPDEGLNLAVLAHWEDALTD